MHVHFLDTYQPRSSPVHALDPRVKLVLTLAFILTSALIPNGAWAAYILLFSVILSVEILSDLGILFVMRRSALALPFMLAALPLLFTAQGEALGSLAIGSWMIRVSQDGLVRFFSIALKSWISMQAAVVMSSSMAFPDLLTAMRAIHVPRLLVAVFGLMWRYLFVLVDEVLRLMRARASRSGQADILGLRMGGSLAWRARVTGGMAGNLFLRGFERSDRIYTAMLSRGYDGEARALPLPEISKYNGLTLVSGLALLVLILGLAYVL